MRPRLLALAGAAVMIAASLTASPAQASHAWSNYHWARTANPFTVELDDNVTAAWDSYLRTASTDWTASAKLNTVVLTGSFGDRNACTPTNGHIEVCNYTYGANGWLGLASISITTGNHISRAYAKMNDTYFNQATYNTPAYRRLVMCQEVGHGFGLGHQDENQTNPNLGSCMDYTRNPAGPPSNEHPNSHDYAQLNTIYTHLDSFNTTASVDGPGSLATDDRATWGKLVSGKYGKGANTFVRDFGNGNRTVTHVFWA
ncbi:zinc metalloprotease [Catelliglobosispora koreensis]|uniref:hypothetical protein n=1 Tax=Catelliglobosispora koreensis TaxID=129052 RepID=UPI00036BC6F3|nr:hypothetical protein [Catelliglobosispora koreensis]